MIAGYVKTQVTQVTQVMEVIEVIEVMEVTKVTKVMEVMQVMKVLGDTRPGEVKEIQLPGRPGLQANSSFNITRSANDRTTT